MLLMLSACLPEPVDIPTDDDYDDLARIVADSGDLGAFAVTVQEAQASGSYDGQLVGLSYTVDISTSGASTEAFVAWSAWLDTLRYTATASGEATWTVDLEASGAHFDGVSVASGSNAFSALSGNRDRTFRFEYAATYDDVVIDYDTEWPRAGSVAWDLEAWRTVDATVRDEVDAHFIVAVEIRFASDGTATITLDGDRDYRLHLANGEVITL